MNKANENINEKIIDAPTLAGFFGGLLIGGVAGAGAMVLLAPQSGKKTRRQMQRKASEMREQTTGTIEDGIAQARTKAHDVSTSIRKQTAALQQRGHEVADEGLERVAPVVDAGKKAGKDS